MLASEVVEKLNFYRMARRNISEDTNLSVQGKERAQKNLMESVGEFRNVAVGTLQMEWRKIRKRYKNVDERRRKAEYGEGERWNYERLNYETESMKRVVGSAKNVGEMVPYAESAVNSGNVERSRVWAELAPAEIRSRFPSGEGNDLSHELESHLPEILETPEMLDIQEDAEKMVTDAHELLKTTNEVENFYTTGVFGSVRNAAEFQKMLEGITLTETLDVQTLNTQIELDIR